MIDQAEKQIAVYLRLMLDVDKQELDDQSSDANARHMLARWNIEKTILEQLPGFRL